MLRIQTDRISGRDTFPSARIDYAVEGLSCEIDIPLGQEEVPVPEKRQGKGDYAKECLKIAHSATDERTRAIFHRWPNLVSIGRRKTKSNNE